MDPLDTLHVVANTLVQNELTIEFVREPFDALGHDLSLLAVGISLQVIGTVGQVFEVGGQCLQSLPGRDLELLVSGFGGQLLEGAEADQSGCHGSQSANGLLTGVAFGIRLPGLEEVIHGLLLAAESSVGFAQSQGDLGKLG